VAVGLVALVWATRGLGGFEKLVLLRIADRVNHADYEVRGTADAFMGTRSLAADCGMSRPTVMKIVRRLIAKGFLEVPAGGVGTRARTLRVIVAALREASGQQDLPLASGQRGLPLGGPSGQEGLPQGVECEERLAVNSGTAAVKTGAASGQQGLPKPEEPVEPEDVHRRAAPACEHEDAPEADGHGPSRAEVPFKVYAAIATKALNASLRVDHTDSVSNITEHFKILCARERPPLPYDSALAGRAVAAACFAREKASRQFTEQLHRIARPGSIPPEAIQ